MQVEHTPGPWKSVRIARSNPAAFHVVCANELHCPGKGLQVVATGVRSEVDARVISATPILLAALQEIIKNDPYRQSSAGIIARKAIANLPVTGA